VGGILAIPAFDIQFSHTESANGPILTATDISIITAVPVSGGLIGAFIVGFVGDKYGRKRTLYLGCLINLIGAVLQTAASDIALLTVGRLLASKPAFFHHNPRFS